MSELENPDRRLVGLTVAVLAGEAAFAPREAHAEEPSTVERKHTGSLLFYVADLLRDPRMQESFSRDPYAALRDAGLGPEHQALLLARSREDLAQAIAQEVRSGEPMYPIPWPTPGEASFTSISPAQGAQHTSVTATVAYVSSAPEAQGSATPLVTCALKNDSGYVIPGTVTNLKIDNQAVNLRVTFPLGDAPVGAYHVVTTFPTGQTVISRPGAFIVGP